VVQHAFYRLRFAAAQNKRAPALVETPGRACRFCTSYASRPAEIVAQIESYEAAFTFCGPSVAFSAVPVHRQGNHRRAGGACKATTRRYHPSL